MNWVFVDMLPWRYDVAAPLVRPMGGSQSAMCYLAAALARRANTVATITGLDSPRELQGVRCLGHQCVPIECFAPEDTVAVVLNGPADIIHRFRQSIRPPRKLILWTQHAPNQPAMRALADKGCAALWD